MLPQPTTPTPLPTTRVTRASKRKSLGGDEELQLEVEQPMMVSTRKKKMRKDELEECLEVGLYFLSFSPLIYNVLAESREEP